MTLSPASLLLVGGDDAAGQKILMNKRRMLCLVLNTVDEG